MQPWVHRIASQASRCDAAAASALPAAPPARCAHAVGLMPLAPRPQVVSPPPGQKRIVGFLQSAGAARGDGGSSEAGQAGEGACARAPEPEPEGDAQPGERQPACDAGDRPARTAEAYFATIVRACGPAPAPAPPCSEAEGGTGVAGGVRSGAQSAHAVALAGGRDVGNGLSGAPGAGGEAGGAAGGEASGAAGGAAGEAAGSQEHMPSLSDWAPASRAPCGGAEPDGAAQGVGVLAGSGEDSVWPDQAPRAWPEDLDAHLAEDDGWDSAGAAPGAAASDRAEEQPGTQAHAGAGSGSGEAGARPDGDGCGEDGSEPAQDWGERGARDGEEEEDDCGALAGLAGALVAERASANGRGPGAAPSAGQGAASRWRCLVCTFASNRPGVLRCALCDTLKGSRAWQPPPGVPPAAPVPSLVPALRHSPAGYSLASHAGASHRTPSGGVKQDARGGHPEARGLASRDSRACAASLAEQPGGAASSEERPNIEAGAPAAGGRVARGGAGATGAGCADPGAGGWERIGEGGGWRCCRCGEVVGGDAGERDCGASPGLDAVEEPGQQARMEHDDYHVALDMQRREAGGAPGGRPGAEGAAGRGAEQGPGAAGRSGSGVSGAARAARGRKRKGSSGAGALHGRGARSARGAMDAFVVRAGAGGS